MENSRPNRLSIDTNTKTGESSVAIAGTIPQLLFNLVVLTAAVCDETGIPRKRGGRCCRKLSKPIREAF